MTDPLELLKQLPQHQPAEALRRAVRVAALEKLTAGETDPWWRRAFHQLLVPAAMAAFSLFYLVGAAGHTPLLP